MAKEAIIHGDRRIDRRYRFEMAVRFSYQHGSVSCVGAGTTVDLSSGGICFVTEAPPPKGIQVELRVTWPFLLQNVCPMELVVRGKVVRNDPEATVVLMQHHEFRTCGTRSFDTADTTTTTCSFVA